MERHFTVSGFVVDADRTLLHWHRKLQIWLPPRVHIDPDEDPVQAVLREVREETGIDGEIVPHAQLPPFTNIPQIPPPVAIIVADVPEGPHQHIDMSYVVRARHGSVRAIPDEDHGFIWVTEEQLRRDEPLNVAVCGVDVAVPEDVRVVGLRAIALVRHASADPGSSSAPPRPPS